MKHQIVLLFSLLLLLLSSFLGSSSRLLVPPTGSKQGENELNVMNDRAIVQSSSEWKDEMEELMGSVECYEKDEECYSRRMIAEAHLDYIYTQQTTP